MNTPKPHVYAIAALSLDGQLGPLEHTSSTNWTSGADTKFFKDKTRKSGVVVMGRTTFETIGQALPGRKNVVYTRRVIETNGINTTEQSPRDLIDELVVEGFSEIAIIGGSSIYTQFLEAKCIDTFYITIEPKLFGLGIPFLTKELNLDLTLISHGQLGDNSLLLEYKVN